MKRKLPNVKHVVVTNSLLALLLVAGCGREMAPPPTVPAPAPIVRARPDMVSRLPHDAAAFTQGLLFEGDHWLESTGQYGESDLREVERATGRVVRTLPLEDRFFGEGLARIGNRLYQLTWQEHMARVVDWETFEEVKRFRYPGEGWGLCTDGENLFLSDGSATIRVLDPETFREVRRFQVTGPQGPVKWLNELEWIQGEIWANVFQSTHLVRFTPQGVLLGEIDLSALPFPEDRHPDQDVLNGIAYDPETDQVWVTGKCWKALYAFPRESVLSP